MGFHKAVVWVMGGWQRLKRDKVRPDFGNPQMRLLRFWGPVPVWAVHRFTHLRIQET
jgi:hypothetical protein